MRQGAELWSARAPRRGIRRPGPARSAAAVQRKCATRFSLVGLLATVLLAVGQRAQAGSVSTGDGLTLTFTAAGEVSSLQIGADELVSAAAPVLWVRTRTCP